MGPSSVRTWTQSRLANSPSWIVSIPVTFIVTPRESTGPRSCRRIKRQRRLSPSVFDHGMGDTIARQDPAEMALADEQAALLEMYWHACSPEAFDEVHVAAELAISDPVTQTHDRLEEAGLGREGIVFIAAPFQYLGLSRLRHIEVVEAAQHAQVRQHAERAVARQQDAIGVDATSATPFAAEVGDSSPMGRSRCQPRVWPCRNTYASGCAESLHDRLAPRIQRFIAALIEGCERQVVHRAPARMEVGPRDAHRHEHAVDVVGDLPGRRALRLSRKGAIEIAGIEGRDARARHCRRQVRGREDDDAAADIGFLQVVNKASQGYLSLILIAMVAGHEQDR